MLKCNNGTNEMKFINKYLPTHTHTPPYIGMGICTNKLWKLSRVLK